MTQTVLLGDIADVLNGAAFSSRDFISVDHAKAGDLPVFKMGNLSIGGGLRQGKDDYIPKDKLVKLQRQITQPNDILMCMTDMKSSMNLLGYSGQIRDELYAVNQRVGIIRPKAEAVSPQFLYYYMNSPDYIYRLRATANSGVQVNLSTSAIRNSEIVLPSLEEQERVADIVGTIDEKIELNRRMNKTLEQMGQALFRHYFIDNPEAEKWESGHLNSQVDIKYGKNLPTKNLQKTGYPVFGGNGQIGYYEKYIYEKPMILVACRGAASGDINISKHKSFVTNNSLALEIKSSSNFTFEYLRFYSYSRKNGYREFVSGSAQPQITVDSLSKCQIPIPPKGLVSSFTAKAKSLVDQMRANDEQTQTLTTLRDTLLPKLISGKVEV